MMLLFALTLPRGTLPVLPAWYITIPILLLFSFTWGAFAYSAIYERKSAVTKKKRRHLLRQGIKYGAGSLLLLTIAIPAIIGVVQDFQHHTVSWGVFRERKDVIGF
jgi:hypothetical protein